MKTLKLVLNCLLLLSGNIIFAQSNLLAPPYPGSISSPLRSNKTQSVFLSKKPIKEIKSFYESKIGTLTKKDKLIQSLFLVELGNTPVVSYGKTIMTSNEISRQEGYPDPDAKDIGVLLIKKVEQSQNQSTSNSASTNLNLPSGMAGLSDSMQKKLEQINKQLMKANGQISYSKTDAEINQMSDLFGGLRNEVYAQRHTKKELLKVYSKYKFLDTSFYTLKKDADGNYINYADQLLKQYKSKLSSAKMVKDNWNYWIGFLKNLTKQAYKTCIVINTKPGSWKK